MKSLLDTDPQNEKVYLSSGNTELASIFIGYQPNRHQLIGSTSMTAKSAMENIAVGQIRLGRDA